MSRKNISQQVIKNPRAASNPTSNKNPRAALIPNDNYQPEFRACQMDTHGPWGWDKLDSLHLQDFLQKIFHSQKLTWQILRDNGSHLVDLSLLIADAQKRLKVLEKDDLDQLYSLRLSGKKRVWGIKDDNILWLLWWDPEHQICPSLKRNT